MQYDGRFRFRAIDPKRFYDAPSVTFIASVAAVIMVQLCLMLCGKPGLRSILGLG